jgi:hypothetical protein
MLADGICNVFYAHILNEKLEGGSPWQICMIEDIRGKFDENLQRKFGTMLPDDSGYKDFIKQYNFQLDRNYRIFYGKILQLIEQSLNKGIIYWSGDKNALPEFFFISSVYKGVDTLYLFKPEPEFGEILFNSIQMMPETQIGFYPVKNLEARAILSDYLGRDMELYE